MGRRSIPFLVAATPPSGGGGGSGPVISDINHAGPSSWGTTIVITPPAGMAAGDHLVLIGYWDGTFSSSDIGTFNDRTPASWLTAPSVRRILISDSFASVPGNITLTFAGSGLWDFTVIAVSNILNAAVIAAGVGATGYAAGARDHAYPTTLADSLAIGFIDYTDGAVTSATTPDAFHDWDISSGGGYGKGFAGVRPAAGSYNASLAPNSSSASEYGWAEIGAA